MKLTTKISVVLCPLLFLLVFQQAHGAVVVHGIGGSSGIPGLAADTPTAWNTVGAVTTVTGVTDGTVVFDYSITLGGDVDTHSATELKNSTLSNRFDDGNAFTVAISTFNVSGGTVNFDGFNYIDASQTDNGSRREGFLIDGTSYVRNESLNGSGDGDVEIGAHGIAISPSVFSSGTLSATAIAENGVRLDGLGWSFTTVTAVPEPSSFLLSGFAGLLIAFRRRRA